MKIIAKKNYLPAAVRFLLTVYKQISDVTKDVKTNSFTLGVMYITWINMQG